MEPNKDQPSSMPSSEVDAAKSHFLDSMGLGESALRELAANQESREREDDIALSSQPDDMELPGATDAGVSIRVQASPGVKISATRQSAPVDQVPVPSPEVEQSNEQDLHDAIEAAAVEPEEKAEDALESECEEAGVDAPLEETQAEESVSLESDLLHLECPKCGGELVLRQEHLGVDGACVWCEAPIVAARSEADGNVRIFPIFQPGPAPVEEKALEPSMPTVDAAEPKVSMAPPLLEDLPAESESIETSSWSAPEVPEEPESVEAQAETTVEGVQENPAASAWSGDFSEPSPDPAKAFTPAPAPAPAPAPEGFSTIVVSEQAEPEMSDGFGSHAAATGFGVPTLETNDEAIESGFGADVPTSFGSPAEPAESVEAKEDVPPPLDGAEGFSGFSSSPEPASDEPTPENEVASGFGAGSSWEAPAEKEASPEFAGFGAAAPEAPTEDAAFPGGFSGESMPAEAQTSENSEAFSRDETPEAFSGESKPGDENSTAVGFLNADAQPESFGAGTPADGDSDPFASAQPVMGADITAASSPASELPASGGFDSVEGFGAGDSDDTVVEDEQPTAFASVDPAVEADQPEASESNSSFEIPANENQESAFGALPSEETMAIPAGFGVSSPTSDPFGSSSIGEAAGMPAPEPVDEAPAEVEETLMTPDEPQQGEAPQTPFSSGSAGEGQTGSSNSFFGSPASSEEGLFSSTPAEVPAETHETKAESVEVSVEGPPPVPQEKTVAETPNVTSQPLGKKPKKTVRKGFVVLMVIIVGFVCGAALASYVLPVDEYVAKARAMMDKKFNPEGLVEMPSPQMQAPAPAPPVELAPAQPQDGTPMPASQAATPTQP